MSVAAPPGQLELLRPELRLAEVVRQAGDCDLGPLEYWNGRPCKRHATEGHDQPVRGCVACGAVFRRHQRAGIAWCYLTGKGLLADVTGSGKTIHALGLCALLRQQGKLERGCVVVCRAAAVGQWVEEAQRLVPNLTVEALTGSKRQRMAKLANGSDIYVISFQTYIRDASVLNTIVFDLLVTDDVDPIINENQTNAALTVWSSRTPRVLVMSATPLQTELVQIYRALVVAGATGLGTEEAFKARYIRYLEESYYTPSGRKMRKRTPAGFKNLDELKQRIRPHYLRRTFAEIDDADIPGMEHEIVYLDMSDPQKVAYEGLRRNVVELRQEGGSRVTAIAATQRLTMGARICAGIGAVEGFEDADRPGVNGSKLDWLGRQLSGEWAAEKVVVFARFQSTIRCLQRRMEALGVEAVTIWGPETDHTVRRERIHRFTSGTARVLLGTTAIEQSLNLQAARILVNVDTMLNPKRMEQLAGRIRRDGSPYNTVYAFTLVSAETQEERYEHVLRRRAALADYVFGEANELYEALSPQEMLALIAP